MTSAPMRAPTRSRAVRRILRRAEVRKAVMAEAWDVDLVRDVVVDGDVVRVSVAGELDAASAARLQRSLDTVIGVSAGAVVLDMSGVSFIDSTGLRVLLVLQQLLTAQRRPLTLSDVSVQTRRLLELSGLSSVFGLDGTS
jgi:anti-sigma B factor antagonist